MIIWYVIAAVALIVIISCYFLCREKNAEEKQPITDPYAYVSETMHRIRRELGMRPSISYYCDNEGEDVISYFQLEDPVKKILLIVYVDRISAEDRLLAYRVATSDERALDLINRAVKIMAVDLEAKLIER